MDKKINELISQLLIEKQFLNQQDIIACFNESEQRQISPLPLIAKRANVPEKQILEIIAPRLNMPYLDLKAVSVDKVLIEKIPVKVASYYKFMPVKLEDRNLTIAVSYPLDVKTQDEIRTHLGFNLEVVLACEEDIHDVMKKYYGLGADTLERIVSQKTYDFSREEAKDERVDDLEALSEDASVIQLVNQIILEAYKKRATDIHIEPYRNKVRLRYRIDGILYDANISAEVKNFLMPILSRIKIMSKLNIVEHRLPQDGRAIVKVQDQNLDLRVSFIPTPHGESVVIRILPAVMLFNLDRLGLEAKELEIFESLIEKPHGIIFLTGPTGSGKTTTLYACLSKINTARRKIITIEDPIEYELEGITQIQITSDVGLTFGRGLRSMLRHDPDVMMVGEVRDLETAEIAIRVALTGHLVFSTLHTNDAASGINRLIDIGVEPYLVASSVEAFIAQRLIRVICAHCKEEDKDILPALKEQIAKETGYADKEKVKVYRGRGCSACNFSGFYGRTAIYEILLVNEAVKKIVAQKSSSNEIKKIAVFRNNMRTLRQSGWEKVIEGVTTADEILRVAPGDESLYEKEAEEPQGAPEGKKVFSSLSPEKEQKPVNPMDNRVYTRMGSKVYVRYKIFKPKSKEAAPDEFEPQMVGITKDISAGGIRFSGPEFLNTGAILDVTLELPDDEKDIQCLARVVRAIEIIPNKDYDIAICFLDLPNAERARLNRYILR
ncbi:MAG: ATPase, T2SS/T4P/T4SS family [Candidatus Omnitrophota bacterium]